MLGLNQWFYFVWHHTRRWGDGRPPWMLGIHKFGIFKPTKSWRLPIRIPMKNTLLWLVKGVLFEHVWVAAALYDDMIFCSWLCHFWAFIMVFVSCFPWHMAPFRSIRTSVSGHDPKQIDGDDRLRRLKQCFSRLDVFFAQPTLCGFYVWLLPVFREYSHFDSYFSIGLKTTNQWLFDFSTKKTRDLDGF